MGIFLNREETLGHYKPSWRAEHGPPKPFQKNNIIEKHENHKPKMEET